MWQQQPSKTVYVKRLSKKERGKIGKKKIYAHRAFPSFGDKQGLLGNFGGGGAYTEDQKGVYAGVAARDGYVRLMFWVVCELLVKPQ